jgi:hypothetical protein
MISFMSRFPGIGISLMSFRMPVTPGTLAVRNSASSRWG